MTTCKKRPKHIPYGSKRKEHWCAVCDKQNIKKEMNTSRDLIKETLIEEIYDRSVKLYYTLADDRMQSCGHPGIPGPVGGEDFSWDYLAAALEGSINTLQVCLKRYKEMI